MLGEPYYRQTEVHPSVRKMQLARHCLRAEEEPPRPKETHVAQAVRAWPHQRACLSGGSIGNPCGALSTLQTEREPEWKVQSLRQGPAAKAPASLMPCTPFSGCGNHDADSWHRKTSQARLGKDRKPVVWADSL